MAFIHVQKAVKDDNGRIIGGYASITESVYDSDGKHHSKHKIVEKLGKILYLSEDKKSGIFLSSTKGIVEYSVTTNTFTPVQSNDSRLVNLPKKHTMIRYRIRPSHENLKIFIVNTHYRHILFLEIHTFF